MSRCLKSTPFRHSLSDPSFRDLRNVIRYISEREWHVAYYKFPNLADRCFDGPALTVRTISQASCALTRVGEASASLSIRHGTDLSVSVVQIHNLVYLGIHFLLYKSNISYLILGRWWLPHTDGRTDGSYTSGRWRAGAKSALSGVLDSDGPIPCLRPG